MLGVHHPDHRLICHQVLNPPSPVPGLLLQLPDSGLLRLLALINQAAGQLPAPPVLHEPMPPQHQHPILIIDQHHHGGPMQPHHVMPEPLTARDLYVDLAQPHPRVVIDHPLAEGPPPARFVACRVSHATTLTPPRPIGIPALRTRALPAGHRVVSAVSDALPNLAVMDQGGALGRPGPARPRRTSLNEVSYLDPSRPICVGAAVFLALDCPAPSRRVQSAYGVAARSAFRRHWTRRLLARDCACETDGEDRSHV